VLDGIVASMLDQLVPPHPAWHFLTPPPASHLPNFEQFATEKPGSPEAYHERGN